MKQDTARAAMTTTKPSKLRQAKSHENDKFPEVLSDLLGVDASNPDKDTSRGKFTELAHAIGVSTAAISNYASGFTGVSVDNLIKIARHYRVSTDYMLGLSDVKTASSTIQAIHDYTGLSAESIEALHYMKNAPFSSWASKNAFASLSFLNRALEYYYSETNNLDYEILKEEYLHPSDSIFSSLEDWVTGSGDATYIKLKNGRIRSDDAFREVALASAMRFLNLYADEDGTFAETMKQTEQLDEEEYERMEDMPDSDEDT